MRRFKDKLFDVLTILFIVGILVWSFLEYYYILNRNVETTVNHILCERSEPNAGDDFYELNQAYQELTAVANRLSGQEPSADVLTDIATGDVFRIPLLQLDFIRTDGYSVRNPAENFASDSFFFEVMSGNPNISSVKTGRQKNSVLSVPVTENGAVKGILRGTYHFERINALISEQYGAISKATAILIVKLLLVVFLVTEYVWSLLRKKAVVLEQQKTELDTLTANIPGGVCCCNNDDFLTIRYLSDGFLHMTGFTRDDIALNFNDQYLRMIYPKDRKTVLAALYASRQTYELRYRIIRKDGAVRWILDKGQLVSEKEDCRMYSVLIDISDQKKTESELNQNRRALEISNEKYQIIINQIGCIIFEYDHTDGTVSFNRAFKNTFGYTPPRDEFPDSFFEEDLLHPDDKERFEKFSQSMLKGAPSCKDVFRIANASRVFLPCLISATTIYDEGQIPIKTVGRISVMEPHDAFPIPLSY